MTEHVVKSWTYLFEPFVAGLKTHDMRVLDRDYKIGDTLLMCEYDWGKKKYTGRCARAKITYITSSKHRECAFSPSALHPSYGILSIRKSGGIMHFAEMHNSPFPSSVAKKVLEYEQ